MGRTLRMIGAIAMLLALSFLATPRQAAAQLGVTWSTGFQVQNLSASSPATIMITFYNADGTVKDTIPAAGGAAETIAAGSSKTYNAVLDVLKPFNGSAVISSDQPVAAILNILGNGTAYGGSVPGVAAENTATTASLPLVQKGNAGFDTWFAVQNAGSTTANVTITFAPGSAGTAHTITKAIPANASETISTATIDEIGVRFVGSVTVASTNGQPLALAANQVGLGNSKTQLSYAGFGAGSADVRLPLVQNGNAGFQTGIAIQNTGATTATVNIAFSANTAGGSTFTPPTVAPIQVGPGASITYLTGRATDATPIPGFGGNTTANRYVGGATITSTQPVVVVVNQLGAATGSSYEGFDAARGSQNVSAPLLMSKNGNFFTGFQCQNVGTVATDITATYNPNSVNGSTFTPPAPVTETVAAGASFRRLQDDANGFTARYVGGATFTSTAAPIVCVVNQLVGGATVDQFLTYDAINF